MKKIFKIAISSIITLALVLVPTTVMAEEGIDYNINYETNLTEGTNNYAIDGTVPYTVYILYPTAVGDYTITSTDCQMGIVSYLDMWVQFEPTADNVNLNTVEWSCTDVNQAIMIGVKADAGEVTITVTCKDPDTNKEIPWTVYENTTAPEKFEMPDFVDVDAFDDGYIDFEDSVIDNAVVGDDGYYHLNDKNGPVLFANLNDSIMSLYTMSGYGRVAAIYYDDAGEVFKKVDYTDAFNEYVAALPTDANGTIASYYYPLTADLIEIFKEIGDTHGWYSGAEAWVYASDDAWLYACYYDEAVTTMNQNANDNNTNSDNKDDTTTDDTTDNENSNNNNTNDNTSGSVNNNNTTNNNTNTDTSNKAPETGDNVAALAIAMISAAVLVVGVKLKK